MGRKILAVLGLLLVVGSLVGWALMLQLPWYAVGYAVVFWVSMRLRWNRRGEVEPAAEDGPRFSPLGGGGF